MILNSDEVFGNHNNRNSDKRLARHQSPTFERNRHVTIFVYDPGMPVSVNLQTVRPRRLAADAGRDLRGIFDVFFKWGTANAQPSGMLDDLSTGKQKLDAQALIYGIDSIAGSYKDVRAAAEECGIGSHFSVMFKLLSKFAHPTAARIVAPPQDEAAAGAGDLFFSNGCLFFAAAFEAIEGQLLALKTSS